MDNRVRIMKEIMDRINKTADCWLWTGAVKKDSGYGRAWYRGRQWRAHRLVYELLIGNIPKGLELDHLCRNRGCVRPSHLEAVTHAENVRRGISGHHNKEKTHCPRGHKYTNPNVYIAPGTNSRSCVKCQRDSTRRWRAEQKLTV